MSDGSSYHSVTLIKFEMSWSLKKREGIYLYSRPTIDSVKTNSPSRVSRIARVKVARLAVCISVGELVVLGVGRPISSGSVGPKEGETDGLRE